MAPILPPYKKPKIEEIGDVEKVEIKQIGDVDKLEIKEIGDVDLLEIEEVGEEEEIDDDEDEDEDGDEDKDGEIIYDDDGDVVDVGNASDYESEEVRQQVIRYVLELRRNDGFDVENCAGSRYVFCGIVPVDLERGDPRLIKAAERCTEVAIAQYNQDQEDDGKLQFMRIVKMNTQACAGPKFYITLEAKNTTTGVIGTYQTKAFYSCIYDTIKVYFLRPKK